MLHTARICADELGELRKIAGRPHDRRAIHSKKIRNRLHAKCIILAIPERGAYLRERLALWHRARFRRVKEADKSKAFRTILPDLESL